MCESTTLSLPRTKCENVRVLFSRIRLLFGVAVEIEDPASSTTAENAENSKLILKMVEGNHDQLNKAKDYLVSACTDPPSRYERRCQYSAEVFAHLVPMRDEVERESSATVRFDAPECSVVVAGGHERNVAAALRFLDAKARDLAGISQAGTLSREVFRQGRNLESEDSSYDSDYEITEPSHAVEPPEPSFPSHHDDVSRTVSDTLGAEFAEYITRDPTQDEAVRDLDSILSDPSYTSRVEFALKLGYTETQVQIALQKLGARPSQNELLAELIKLGASAGPRATPEGVLEGLEAEGAVEEGPPQLRHIVVDGSNVAMSHGNKECFSCRGIKICVDWFRARGHQNITVFVPRWRKEVSRPDAPIKDQDILAQLEKERLLVFTPSRHVGGRRMVCYDDRYILKLAVDSDGIVVSNDNYRDLVNESPEFKKVVEDRLLMYSFVNDRFMPPDDPLGRHGPSLDVFLRKSNFIRTNEPLPPPCPYGKKCTYGNKCKYYHPERGNQPQKSVTERLAEQAKIPLQEVKSRGLKSRESSPGDKLKSQTSVSIAGGAVMKKQPLSRTKSLVPSSSHLEKPNVVERTKSDSESLFQPLGFSPSVYPWPSTMPQISLSTESPHPSGNWASIPATLPPNISDSCAEMFLEPDAGGHLFVAKRLSDPDNHGAKPFQQPQPETANLHRKLQRQLTLNPSYDPRLVQLGGYVERTMLSPQQEYMVPEPTMVPRASSQENIHLLQPGYGYHQPLSRMGSDSRVASTLWEGTGEHQTVTRNASAPDSYNQWPPSARMQHLNSTSDTRLNMRHWLSQSRPMSPAGIPLLGSSVQEHSPSGMARGTSQVLGQPVRPSSVPPPSLQLGLMQQHQARASSPDLSDGARHRLYFHLSSIFPKEHVKVVMDMYPQETNPQKICAAILNMFPKG